MKMVSIHDLPDKVAKKILELDQEEKNREKEILQKKKETTKIERFTCECGFSSTTKRGMKIHEARMHPNKKTLNNPKQTIKITPLQQHILRTLVKEGPCSMHDLVEQLQENLTILEKQGKIKKTTKNNGQRGRPFNAWAIRKTKKGVEV